MIRIKKEKVLVKPKDIKPTFPDFEVLGTLNPAAIRMSNNDILLYVRVIEKPIKDEDEKYLYSPRFVGKKQCKIQIDKFDKEKVKKLETTKEGESYLDFSFRDGTKRLKYISHLRRVILDPTGFKVKSIDTKPSFFGLESEGELGIEDPRITKIDNFYTMTYVGLSIEENISTSLAISKDCKTWQRKGIIFKHQNKDIALFPEKIKDRYVALNRPEGTFQFTPPHIWLSYSKDLIFWGRPTSLNLAKKGEWDWGRVGAGPPPLKTDKGWLFIYHGVKKPKTHGLLTESIEDVKEMLGLEPRERYKYSAGVALLDLNKPRKVLAKAPHPIIRPTKKHEKGTFEKKDVVFPTGLVPDLNGKDLLIFSGGGDRVTTVKKISLSETLKTLKKVNYS
tara:strand:- start:668 stop:1843 length:1176 start_codon:yes stop_codon:yes gene_type:complete